MHCTGCWAAEYGDKMNLSFEDMDKVVTEGKELGIHAYLFTGGEPLIKKKEHHPPLREAQRLRVPRFHQRYADRRGVL